MVAEIQRALAEALQHATAQGTALRSVVPAPVRGLNTIDPESAMDELYATRMINWFPDHGRLVTRRGSSVWVDITGETGEVGTLHSWVNGNESKLLAWSRSALYDVTDSGSSSVLKSTGITSSRWSVVNMNGFAICVNGVDVPFSIDGDGALADHGFSGLDDPETLDTVQVHRGRLFFTQRESSKIWYGGADAVKGALTEFDLAGITPEGGACLAIGSLSVDTGSGADDLIVFLMERGQVLLYSGGDPSGDEWRINGVFQLAPVIGRNPMVKLGADLIVITTDGYLPLIQFLTEGREQQRLALSNKVTPTIKRAIELFGSATGWQGLYYGSANWLLFNVGGLGGGPGVQHVMNTNSGAWTEFHGMPAACWAEHEGKLFFGTNTGKVVEANVPGDDDGEPIFYSAQSAYSYLNSPYDKLIRAVRPHFRTSGATADINFGVIADFGIKTPLFRQIRVQDSGQKWADIASWDDWRWGSGEARFRQFKMVTTRGAAVATRVELTARGGDLSWFSTDLLWDGLKGSLPVGGGQ